MNNGGTHQDATIDFALSKLFNHTFLPVPIFFNEQAILVHDRLGSKRLLKCHNEESRKILLYCKSKNTHQI